MITWIRTAKTLPGRFIEGVAWAEEIETTIEHITGKKLVVATTFGGTTRRDSLDWAVRRCNGSRRILSQSES